jgi:hypothetical protein
MDQPHLKLARVHAVVGLNEGVTKVVDAILDKALQRAIVEVQVVGVSEVIPATKQRVSLARSGSSDGKPRKQV